MSLVLLLPPDPDQPAQPGDMVALVVPESTRLRGRDQVRRLFDWPKGERHTLEDALRLLVDRWESEL